MEREWSDIIKQKFYSGKKILNENAQYNLIYGERSNGKSYWIKEYCVTQAYNNDNLFVYLRRFQMETKPVDVESYFADTPITAITKSEYTTISVWRGNIYLANIDDNGKVIRGKLIGRVLYLNGAEHFKSQAFPNYGNVIYEEVITKNMYLPNEPSILMDLISTIARRRQIRVWLIGNTISRVCPYYTDWSLLNIPRQQQGTIDIYNFKTNQKNDNGDNIVIKIAVEYCANSGNNSKMFFGKKADSITSGSWEVGEHPSIENVNEYTVAHEILLISNGFKFCMQLCVDENTGGKFIYVYPYTSNRYVERIISDEFSTNPLHTDKLLDRESFIRNLINDNMVVYSDNLTAEDFLTIIKMKKI